MTEINLSTRIKSEDCQGCGRCCESFEIWYPKDSPDILLSEIQRFQLLKTIGERITTRKEKDGTWLIFNFPCLKLNSDKTCSIHENPDRPLLCLMFPYPETTKEDCFKVK
jgi:Fe-S-cluster containining protein